MGLPQAKDCSWDNLVKQTCLACFNDTLCVLRHQKREKHVSYDFFPFTVVQQSTNPVFYSKNVLSRLQAKAISDAGFRVKS